MKKFIFIFVVSFLFMSCKRNHYYCNCRDNNGSVYTKDYGTQFATRESDYKKDCDSHLNHSSSTTCNIIAE